MRIFDLSGIVRRGQVGTGHGRPDMIQPMQGVGHSGGLVRAKPKPGHARVELQRDPDRGAGQPGGLFQPQQLLGAADKGNYVALAHAGIIRRVQRAEQRDDLGLGRHILERRSLADRSRGHGPGSGLEKSPGRLMEAVTICVGLDHRRRIGAAAADQCVIIDQRTHTDARAQMIVPDSHEILLKC